MTFSIRPERDEEDRAFIERLNPRLTEVINAPTHSDAEVEAFQAAFTATAWEQSAGRSATFLAVDEANELLGYVSVREGSDEVLSEPCAYIALLAVERMHEGKGVAKALIQKAEEWALEMGYARVALDVFGSNTRAFEFYKRAGFQVETVRVIKKL
ncbi:GNAT family N-acetyltransferase [Altererythrobacter confluentis]|uniref:GNAT family N-acetyltransferase n=1 Tax=Allopontixanthobacter confluentis TaxID=1849021 RepID=A0A6L7GDR6_9SPHN|nr:GNAT family N-acetyltransferase [Allopontixanthobacter confluentis]MXP13606.1 GNAT family N-acetyltransferase [Allopontixanthobacter confluentis]